ncbi:hypothetical protein [Metabacillus endolithicus]|uniref:Uncharacterized protein n=1 Tax=Metabacillus endolithicus TaxID=1535204 RepID=A0ABW5C2H1_9BACI|nr:hypothetical protein [Metabacillus endolithicus]UPG66046.1 hypothetical protein MVE64_26760 [Metabacillus endolithicus]
MTASNVSTTSGSNVQTELDSLKSSVNNGKTTVKNAIIGKGGTVLDGDGDGVSTFAELESGVKSIPPGLKVDPLNELLVSTFPYSKKSYNNSSINNILAISDKYVVYQNAEYANGQLKVIDRDSGIEITTITLPTGYLPYTRSYNPCAAINGDWLYCTMQYNSAYDVFAINVLTGNSTFKTFGNTNRVESLKLCSDGYVYGVSYGTISKWDNKGNRLYMTNFSSTNGGGDRVFDVIDNVLYFGNNNGGKFVLANPSTGNKITDYVVSNATNNAPSHLFKIGSYFFVCCGVYVARFTSTWTNDIIMGDTLGIYKITDTYFLAFKRDTSTYPAGGAMYNPDLTIKKMSITAFSFQSAIANENEKYIELIQGFGASSDSAQEMSVVRMYKK